MQHRVQSVIEGVAPRYIEKRTGVFQIEARCTGNTVVLGGRVLENAALSDLRQAITNQIPSVRIDDAEVRVLRREPAVRKIVSTNVTDLRADPSFLSELLTQVLNGQPLEILEEANGWSYVRQNDGYLGWAYSAYLEAANDTPAQVTHLVTAPVARLLFEPMPDAAVTTCLLCGTAVHVVKRQSDWAQVKPAGGMLAAGWIPVGDLRDSEAPHVHAGLSEKGAQTLAQQIIGDARRLTGVYYLWGGTTPFGLDCSALVQLTHRLNGFTLPRDAYMQFAIGKPVAAPYQPGDLLYFHSDSDKQRITHVGISLGGWNMIHSSRAKNGVYEENVQSAARLRDTFAGARTFIR